jgi:hypothetical protein
MVPPSMTRRRPRAAGGVGGGGWEGDDSLETSRSVSASPLRYQDRRATQDLRAVGENPTTSRSSIVAPIQGSFAARTGRLRHTQPRSPRPPVAARKAPIDSQSIDDSNEASEAHREVRRAR